MWVITIRKNSAYEVWIYAFDTILSGKMAMESPNLR
jgi:hypothetical protein